MLRRFLHTTKPYMMKTATINEPITITPVAWNKIADIATKSNINRFFFSAKSGGCNGFNYSLTTIENNTDLIDKLENDKIKPTIIMNNSDERSISQLEVIIDPMAEMLLFGTTIDYVEEDYTTGQYESKFV